MRSRAGRIAFLVFQAVWLNAILPGHTRGLITLPGSPVGGSSCHESSTAMGGGCCPTGVPSSVPSDPADPTDAGKRPPVDPGRLAHCALCHFAARLTVPPPVDLAPAPRDVIGVLADATPGRCVSLRFAPPYDACGPP